jgi:hypothetical protein
MLSPFLPLLPLPLFLYFLSIQSFPLILLPSSFSFSHSSSILILPFFLSLIISASQICDSHRFLLTPTRTHPTACEGENAVLNTGDPTIHSTHTGKEVSLQREGEDSEDGEGDERELVESYTAPVSTVSLPLTLIHTEHPLTPLTRLLIWLIYRLLSLLRTLPSFLYLIFLHFPSLTLFNYLSLFCHLSNNYSVRSSHISLLHSPSHSRDLTGLSEQERATNSPANSTPKPGGPSPPFCPYGIVFNSKYVRTCCIHTYVYVCLYACTYLCMVCVFMVC